MRFARTVVVVTLTLVGVANAQQLYNNSTSFAGNAFSVTNTSANSSAVALYGTSTSSTAFAGVSGFSTGGNGVYGQSSTGVGVYAYGGSYGVNAQATSSGGTGVAAAGDHYGVYGTTLTTTLGGVGVYGTTLASNGIGLEGIATGSSSTGVHGEGVIYGLYGSSGSASSTNYGVYGTGTGAGTYGVYGTSAGYAGVYGQCTANNPGVYGNNLYNGTHAWGVYGYSEYSTGVYGSSTGLNGVAGYTASTGASGVYAEDDAQSFGYGLAARATTSSGIGAYGENMYSGTAVYGKTNATGIAVEGYAVSATSGYAGYFIGPVSVNGTLSKSGGSFKIDHPVDPANKYLYHSFVESPDMKNVYDGVVLLDASGSAVVTLPDWFEALNQDFRYQLTCIGGYAPVYISKEVVNHQFAIAGGASGLKVSWQVTGTRHDAWANAHRIPVEEAKAAADVGRYLHPELFGADEASRLVPAGAPLNRQGP